MTGRDRRRTPEQAVHRSAVRPTSAGTRRATSSSPTATAIAASSSTTRTAGSSSRSAQRGNGAGPAATRRTRWRWTPQGNVYVADRSNARIQVFDNDLTLQARSTTTSARPWAVCISPGPHQYLFVPTPIPTTATRRAAAHDRRDLQDGARRHHHRQVRQGRQGAGGVQHGPRDRLPQPERALRLRDHGWRVQKIMLHPQPTTTTSAAR